MFGFRRNVKASFKRMRDHVDALEQELRVNREFIISQNKQIEVQNSQILGLLHKIKVVEDKKASLSAQNDEKRPIESPPTLKNTQETPSSLKLSPLNKEDSIRNKGVSLDGYSTDGYSTVGYSLDIRRFQEGLPIVLARLSRQEFLTFLTVYHQEEQSRKVTYESVAGELKISSGCVRTYVGGLIKKGLPVVKSRYNNKLVILSIPSEIRSLNLKKKLVQEFYNLDPNQTRLGEDF